MNDIETNTGLLIVAAHEGNTTEVQRLISLSDPTNYHSRALLKAVRQKHMACVQLLIPVSNPHDCNTILVEAVKVGYGPNIELLIAAADPKFNASEALYCATEMQNDDIIEMLIDVSDVDEVLRDLKNVYTADEAEAWERLEVIVEARRQNKLLHKHIDDSVKPAVPVKPKI